VLDAETGRLILSPSEVTARWFRERQQARARRAELEEKYRPELTRAGCTLAGESLKRVPPGYPEEHPFAEDLKRKDFAAGVPLDDGRLTRGDAVAEVLAGFRRMAPFMRFVCNALELPF
jgi:uncharacterized protein (DUF2461 family)